MALYEKWKTEAYEPQSEAEYESFWKEYLPKEQAIYEYLLSNKDEVVSGSIKTLAEKFNIDPVTFIGFMDGINSSLVKEYDVETLEEDSEVNLDLDMEALYYNMHEAKADWLYNLPQWNELLSAEKREEIEKQYKKSKTVVKEEKVGRNDPCICGSGKKYKKCCYAKDMAEEMNN